jgi:hypothetical protein
MVAMPLIGDLTRPENGAELRQRRAIADRVKACGGCALCLKRDRAVIGWGRSVCTTAGRTFPQCATDEREPRFELDEQQIRERH